MALVLGTRTPAKAQNQALEQDVRGIGQQMRVALGPFSAWMIGVGSIIGSMAWLFHGYMIARAGALAAVMSWAIAMILYIPVTLILAELASMFPSAGGPYLYKYYAFKRVWPRAGEMFGFLTGWLFWASLMLAFACMANGLCNLLSATIYGAGQSAPIWFGPLVIVGLIGGTSAVNLLHVDRTAMVNNLLTVLKFAMALGFAGLVITAPSSSINNMLSPINQPLNSTFMASVFSVLTIAIGGFGGIELIACASSETRGAARNVPKAMFLTLISVGLIYTGMCAAVAMASGYTLRADKAMVLIPGTMTPATVPSLTELIAGTFWGRIATACVVASIVGSGIGGLLATARVGYSMAVTGLFPSQFAQLDPTTKVPVYAVRFQCACICLIAIAGNLLTKTGLFPDAYSFLAETFCFIYLVVLVLYGASLMILRHTDPQMERPFRIGKAGNWLAWLVSASAIIVFGYVAVCCTQPIYQLSGLVLLLCGIPIYAYYRRK